MSNQAEPNQPGTETDDALYDKFFPYSVGERPSRKPRDLVSWMNRDVTFCGVKKSLREWIQESGLRKATVRVRLNRNMDPVAALTTPDRDGHCLKPPSAEYLEAHRKAQQKARSRATKMVWGDDNSPYVAGIMAHGRKLLLGTYNTRDEAEFAFNRAVDLLPGEYESSDKYEAVDLDLLTRVRIENAVRASFEAHGMVGELESERGDD